MCILFPIRPQYFLEVQWREREKELEDLLKGFFNSDKFSGR